MVRLIGTMKKITQSEKLTIQVILACILTLAGLALLFLGFFAIPIGEISASVLTAFGEAGTFAGALLGIDYTYRFKVYKLDRHIDRYNNDEVEEEV